MSNLIPINTINNKTPLILQLNINIKNKKIYKMDNCTLDCIQMMGNYSYSEMCTFTKSQCHQDTVQFVQAYYCLFNSSFMILVFLGIPLFVFLFKILNVIASEYLSPCVDQFIHQFKISPTLAGVTFLAFANGAPDVMTAIIAGSSDSNTTALIPFGSIFGACLFSAAFILSTVILLQPNETISLKQRSFVLPLVFYIASILFIIGVTTIYGKMNIYLALALLVLYLIYIVVVVKTQKDGTKKDSLIMTGVSEEDQNKITSQTQQKKLLDNDQCQDKKGFLDKLNDKSEVVINFVLRRLITFYKIQQWHPINTIISLIVSPIIIASTQQMPKIFKSFVGPIQVMLLISIPAVILLGYTIYSIVRHQQPYYIRPFTIYSFFVSVCALTFVCSVLINFVQLIQILTGANSVFLGLTVFSWANSIGDYLTITHFARHGNPQVAIAGIFSGQLFNFLLGFGIFLTVQSIDGPYQYKIFDFVGDTYDKISDSIVMTVIFGGLFYLIYMLVVVIRNKGVLMRKQALFGWWYYVAFLGISCALAVLTDFFNQFACDI